MDTSYYYVTQLCPYSIIYKYFIYAYISYDDGIQNVYIQQSNVMNVLKCETGTLSNNEYIIWI